MSIKVDKAKLQNVLEMEKYALANKTRPSPWVASADIPDGSITWTKLADDVKALILAGI